MKRYLSKDKLSKLATGGEIHFIVKKVINSCGDLDLRFRGHYFNLYYKGNSLAKIEFNKNGYNVSIHHKFVDDIFDNDYRLSGNPIGQYICFRGIDAETLHVLLQTKYLTKLYSKIKEVNHSEELIFEQILMTDNLDNEYLIVIDRQVTETALEGTRMDLLGLRKIKDDTYGFLIIEIKLGNNKELEGKVGEQIKGYVEHLQKAKYFKDWKENYEIVFNQMHQLGLIKGASPKIDIVNDIKGILVVAGYSVRAKGLIRQLKLKYPDSFEIKQIENKL